MTARGARGRTRQLPVALGALVALLVLMAAACGGAASAPSGGADAAASPTATAPDGLPTDATPTDATGGDATGGDATATDAPPAADGPVSGTVRLYASVTQDTVDAVVDAFEEANPDAQVELFRAPTGELNARMAAERRDGDIMADVLWLTDPLSMQQFAAEDLLREWTPAHADAVPAAYRHDTFWGTRLLHMVIVHQADLEPVPGAWSDLVTQDWEEPVVIPDPGFAGSAFGALGWFALTDGFGFDYYRSLADGGAVQVQAPGEVVTGVAEGRFAAGMTLARPARSAMADGAPVGVVVPEPGAIAIYSPIAVLASTDDAAAAEAFADFTLTEQAQQLIAATGWQPVRPDVAFDDRITDTVSPDWEAAFDRQDELLEQYRTIVGG